MNNIAFVNVDQPQYGSVEPSPPILPPPENDTNVPTSPQPQYQQLSHLQRDVKPYSDNTNERDLEAEEYLNGIEVNKLVKYFKLTTVFFMILGPFMTATTWMFIPTYDASSGWVFFFIYTVPFIAIYRINLRFLGGDYYNHYHYANIVNDFPFVIFLLKLSSAHGVLLFGSLAGTVGGYLMMFLMLIGSIYSWGSLGKMSIHLRKMYEKYEKQHAALDDYTFIRPIIPLSAVTNANYIIIHNNCFCLLLTGLERFLTHNQMRQDKWKRITIKSSNSRHKQQMEM